MPSFFRTPPRLVSIALTAALLLSAPAAIRAAVIVSAGFEASGDTWTGETLSGTGGSFSSDNGIGQFPSGQRILEGTQSFQTNLGTATVDFDPIDVSGYDSILLTVRVSSTSATSGNGSDSTFDAVRLFVSLDGAAFAAMPDIQLSGNSNARWGYDAGLIGTTPAGTPLTLKAPQGGTSTNNFSTLTISIPDSALSVDFRIVAQNDNSGEFWNIDAVSLTGVAVPEPSVGAVLMGGIGVLLGFRRLRGPLPRT